VGTPTTPGSSRVYRLLGLECGQYFFLLRARTHHVGLFSRAAAAAAAAVWLARWVCAPSVLLEYI
jgi:hypothetical protein